MSQSGSPENVPRRQFSLFQPKYEELYTFWWKCMQITLHDKGTQTMEHTVESIVVKDQVKEAVELTKMINGGDAMHPSLQHILSAIEGDLTPIPLSPERPQLNLSTELIDNKCQENDQLKQLMAMVNYYNSVGRENRGKARTFRGAGALAQGLSPSMLAPLSGLSLSDIQNTMTQNALSASLGSMVENNNHLDSTPVMEQRALLTPISSVSPIPSTPSHKETILPPLPVLTASPEKNIEVAIESVTVHLPPCEEPKAPKVEPTPPILVSSPVLQTPRSSTLSNSSSTNLIMTSSTTTPLLAAALPQNLTPPIAPFSIKSEQPEMEVKLEADRNSPQSETDSMTEYNQLKSSLKLNNTSSMTELYSESENLNDLLQIKQLTDALGRKAVLDSLTVSSAQDLSSYFSMAQAASLIGQLPVSNTRSLFNPLCSMPLYMGQSMKTDGFSTFGSSIKLDQQTRHYAASAENDTSTITLPEGFEIDENLTWTEVENFVNEFKTKRVKLGYTQAHVGAALALVHGPEFSQTTISRFEGLQLSFANHKKIIPILRRWLESVENPAKRKHSPNAMHNHHTNNSNAKRRKRTTISSNSKEILEQYYQTNPLPSTEEIGNLSNNLALDKRVIRIWFQNRRAIGKRLSKLIVTMGGGAHHSQAAQNQLQQMKLEPFGTF